MMASTNSLAPLEHQGDMALNWKRYKRRIERFVEAYCYTASERKKIAILLNGAGDSANDVFDSFQFTSSERDKLDAVLTKFDHHYMPEGNSTYRRHQFFTRKEMVKEPYEEYMTALKNLGNICKFDSLYDGLVRDIFICVIIDKEVQIKLLGLGDVDSTKVMECARNQAHIRQQVQAVKLEVKEEPVDFVRSRSQPDYKDMKTKEQRTNIIHLINQV